MTDLIVPGKGGVAVRASSKKKAGAALVAATLAGISVPFQVASRCGLELQGGSLRHLNDHGLGARDLPAAKFNHGKMLSRAAMVRAARSALLPIFVPPVLDPVTPQIANAMLTALFRGVGKAKNVDTATLIETCIEMFDPSADVVGMATGMWQPICKHPVILAMAVRKLINSSVFTSAAEFRTAMNEARANIIWLADDTESWLTLLQKADRVLFEHDRTAWDAAYANVGSDVAKAMQDPGESGGYEDDNGEDIPPSARWIALEAMLEAPQTGGKP